MWTESRMVPTDAGRVVGEEVKEVSVKKYIFTLGRKTSKI
jgi:hypothetical protein